MRSEYYHRFTGGVVGALLLALCATDARGMENNMLDAIRRVQPGPHPYLFFQAGDLPELRAKMTVSPTREMWERIRSYADRLIAEPFAPPEGAAYVRFTREAAGQIRGLALAYVLGGDERHADRAIQEVEWLLGREAWVENPPRRDRKPGYAPDRVTATSGYAVAQVYDMLYDRLTPEQRQRIRQAVLEKSIKPIVNRGGSDASTYWLKWYTGNWADAAYGEIGVAAMAFLGEEPGAADIVAFAAENVQRALEAACRDGGWGEGLLYYSVAWGTPTYFLHRLRKLTHGEVDLTDHPFLKNTHLFPLYFLMPGRATYARIGNCSTGPPHSAHLLAILAAEYQNAHAQWLANLGVGNLAPAQWIAGYTRYDRNLEAKPPLDLPKAKLFRGVNWAAFRSGWDNPDDVFFTFKGGHGNWDHIHGDFNSFTLNAYGAELLVDLGYVGEVWGCRTEAHNTIRVNEQDQFPRTRPAGGATQPDRFCALSEFVNTDRYDHVLGDATTTYNGVDRGQVVNNVKKATREMMYLRPDVFVIYDDVQTTGPVPVDWLAHTLGEITVKGETVTVTQGGAAVDIAVIEPARFDARVQSGPPADTEIRIDDRRTKQHPFVRIRPVEATDHTRMLTVLLPRRAGERQQAVTTPIRAEGVLGVRIAKGDVTGIALFATGEGGIRHSGIATDARSCFLLLQGERLVQVAIHRGARAEYQGQALFPARAERRESIVWQEGQALVEE